MSANSGQSPTPTVVILAPAKWVTTNGQRTRHHYDQAATVTPWRQAAAIEARVAELDTQAKSTTTEADTLPVGGEDRG